MGLRETINDRPAVMTGVTIAILVVALGVIGYQIWPRSGVSGNATGGSGVFYTSDGGNTFAEGPATDTYTLGPDGKPKARARLFVWEEGGDPFVGYLERATADAVKRRQGSGVQGQGGSNRPEVLDFEVARKGESKWHKATSEEGQQIARPPTRDGKAALPYP